jgi:hypothetical protein
LFASVAAVLVLFYSRSVCARHSLVFSTLAIGWLFFLVRSKRINRARNCAGWAARLPVPAGSTGTFFLAIPFRDSRLWQWALGEPTERKEI